MLASRLCRLRVLFFSSQSDLCFRRGIFGGGPWVGGGFRTWGEETPRICTHMFCKAVFVAGRRNPRQTKKEDRPTPEDFAFRERCLQRVNKYVLSGQQSVIAQKVGRFCKALLQSSDQSILSRARVDAAYNSLVFLLRWAFADSQVNGGPVTCVYVCNFV